MGISLTKKTLGTILSRFDKITADLDSFITTGNKDIDAYDLEASRIASDRAAVAADIGRATRTKQKLADLIA